MAANLARQGQRKRAMSKISSITHRLPLTLGDIRNDEERVIIYCLSCGRSRDMLVYTLRKMVGPISLGTVNGRFGCRGKGGCGKAMGMVLPRVAPTPAAWARLYRPQASDREIRHDAPPDDFPFHIERWTEKPAARECTVAQLQDTDVAYAAFELACNRMRKDLGRQPYLLLRHQGRVLRDSRRDFKMLPGGRSD